MKPTKNYYFVFIALLFLQTTMAIGQNNAPTAQNDTVHPQLNATEIWDIIANDTDIDGDNIALDTILVSPANSGFVTLNPDGTFTYTPLTSFRYVRSDQFSYRICDDGSPSYCDTATVVLSNVFEVDTVLIVEPSSCSAKDGSITIVASGGGQLSYSLDGDHWQTNPTFTGIGANEFYQARISNGVYVYNSVFAHNPIYTKAAESPIVDSVSSTTYYIPCDSTNGFIIIHARADTTLLYSIDDGTTWQTDSVFNNLRAGSYRPVVKRVDNNCVNRMHKDYNKVLSSQGFNIYPWVYDDCQINDASIIMWTGHIHGFSNGEYSIDNGQTWQYSAAFNNLSPGTYHAVARYKHDGSCLVTVATPLIVEDYSTPNASISHTPVSACGQNDGSITITATGGNNLQYSINDGVTWQSSPVFNNLSLGNYQVQVASGNGKCSLPTSTTVNITHANAPTIASVNYTHPTDCSVDDGTITILASGTSALEYSIDGVNWSNINVFINLSSGEYCVKVRNVGGSCEVTYLPCIQLNEPTPIVISAVSYDNPSDCSANDGKIVIENYSSQYSYSIDSGNTWQTGDNCFFNLSCGTYDVQVQYTDSTCRRDAGTVFLDTIDYPIVANYDSYTSFDDKAISGDVSLNDHDPDGLPLWYNPVLNSSPSIGNLIWNTDGTFSYTPPTGVTQSVSFYYQVCDTPIRNGMPRSCKDVYVSLYYLARPVATTDNFQTTTDVSINQSVATNDWIENDILLYYAPEQSVSTGNGTYSITANGNFTYTPNLGFVGLDSFSYIVRSYNNSNAADTGKVFIQVTYPNYPIALDDYYFVKKDSTLPADISLNDISPTALIYQIIPIVLPQGSIVNNPDGTFSYTPNLGFTGLDSFVYVTCNTSNYCDTATAYINVTTANVSTITTNPILPCTQPLSSLTVHVIDSTLNLEFTNDNGLTWQSSPVFDNLYLGTYHIATREIGSTIIDYYHNNPVYLSLPNTPQIDSVQVVNSSGCHNGSNGQIKIFASSDTNFPYEYSLDNQNWRHRYIYDPKPFEFNNLSGGHYKAYTRWYSNNCPVVYQAGVTLTHSNGFTSTPVTTDESVCGAMDGSITMNTSSDSAFIVEYSIDNGATWQISPTFSGLGTGNYQIDARTTDGSCQQLYFANIITSNLPTISNISFINPTGCDSLNGSITIHGIADTALLYSIDGGISWQADSIFNNLTVGTYQTVVKEINSSCIVYYWNGYAHSLYHISAPYISYVQTSDNSCGSGSGSILVEAQGGNWSSYEVSIDSGTTWTAGYWYNSFDNLADDTYHIIVRNADSTCPISYVQPQVIQSQIDFEIASINSTDVSACGTADGTITVTVNNPSAVQYSIDNGANWQSNNLFNNLSLGSYQILTKGGNTPCFDTAHVNIGHTSAPVINNIITTNLTNCGGADGTITIQASGGSGSYEYSVDNGVNWISSNIFSGLSHGFYIIVIRNTASNTCLVHYHTPVEIKDKVAPTIHYTNTNITNGNCSGTNGYISIGANSGNVYQVQYSIDGGTTWQTSGNFSGLSCTGTYPIQVRNLDSTCVVMGSTITYINNLPPVGLDDYLSLTNDKDTFVNVMANDYDPENDAIYTRPYVHYFSATDSIYLDSTGILTVPTTKYPYAGMAFHYQVCEYATGRCEQARISLSVYPPTLRPVIVDDYYTIQKDSILNENAALNDYDPGSGFLVYSTNYVKSPSHGTLNYTPNGIFTYTPNIGFVGVDTFAFQIRKGNYLPDTGYVFVTVIDSILSFSPVAIDDYFNTNENTSVNDNLLANDYDPSGNNLTVNTSPVSPPSNGIVVISASGSFVYTPNLNFTGLDSFSYTICNTLSFCDTATVYININYNNPPVALADNFSIWAGSVFNHNVLFNDSDIDNHNLLASLVNSSNHGTLIFNSDGSFNYTSSNTYAGIDSFVYKICDNGIPSKCDTATAYIDITLNYAPVAIADSFSTLTGIAVNGNVLSNDYDINNHSIASNLISTSIHGTVTLSPNGIFTYTSSNTYSGIDSFVYRICDSGLPVLCDTATVYINIISNNTPTAVVDTFVFWIADTITGNVLTNDFDIDNHQITAGLITAPAANHGTLTFNTDGSFTYGSSTTYFGIDSFQYQICDNGTPSLCDTTMVYFDIRFNDAPIAVNDTFNPLAANPVPWNILANDYDINNDSLILSFPIAQPNYGTIIMQANGTFTYNQNTGFIGLDSFQYQICDDGTPQLCNAATVYIMSSFDTLRVNNVTITNTNCSDTTGNITVHASGGVGNYEYSKDANATWQTSNVFDNLPQGSYTISVRDASFAYAYPVNNPVVVSGLLQPIISNTTYANNILTINGNISNAEYSIDCGVTWQNSNIFSSIMSGNYCIGIRHANDSCTVFSTINLINTAPTASDVTYTAYVSAYTQHPEYAWLSAVAASSDLQGDSLVFVPDTFATPTGVHQTILGDVGIIYVPLEDYKNGPFTATFDYIVYEYSNPTHRDTGTITLQLEYYTWVSEIKDTIAIGAMQSYCLSTEELVNAPSTMSWQSLNNRVVLNNVYQDSCVTFYADEYGIDTVLVFLCDNLGICDTTRFVFDVQDGVWPGDTDDDTDVNNFDLLNIGLGYGSTGTSRDSVSIVWNGFITPKWNIATPISNIDYKHLDCNGDGIINATDTMAIIQNWGQTYQRSGGGILGGAPIVVDTTNLSSGIPKFSLPILLGDMANPVANLYGGAFSITYDTNYIKKDSVYITFDTSFVGINDIDMISITKNFGNHQRIDAAFTRIDGVNVNGYGIIGQINFTIKDDILRPVIGHNVVLMFNVTNTKFISNDETIVPVDEISTDMTLTSVISQPMLNHLISVFPNPTKDYINIISHDLNIENITITDVTGRIMLNQNVTPKDKHQLELSQFASGVYSIQLKTDKGMAVKRLVVVK